MPMASHSTLVGHQPYRMYFELPSCVSFVLSCHFTLQSTLPLPAHVAGCVEDFDEDGTAAWVPVHREVCVASSHVPATTNIFCLSVGLSVCH